MSTEALINNVSDRFQTSANVRTVYGEPIVAEGKTIIPVAKVCYGVAAGSGQCQPDGPDEKPEAAEGICGGVGAKPAGVIEITPERTRFIPYGEVQRVAVAAVAGAVGGYLLSRLFCR